MPHPKTAAFFRVEGTLIDPITLASSAYFGANGPTFSERFRRLGELALAAPAWGLLQRSDRTMANRLVSLTLRGLTEDRISVLAQEYFEDLLRPKIYKTAQSLVTKAKDRGFQVVLLSEAIEPVISPIQNTLKGIDHLVANRLEFRDGKATGKLLSPVIGGHETRSAIEAFATKAGIDLAHSTAFASSGADLLLLAAVGQPCAVNPDFALRQAARQARWPILETRS